MDAERPRAPVRAFGAAHSGAHPGRALVALLVLLGGCPSLGPEGVRADAGNGGCEGVACDPGLVCSHGRCVDGSADEDGDGYTADRDCDDGDPAVVPGSTAACSSECGDGTTTCTQGAWSECTAPVDCSCSPGEKREEPCGRCGIGVRQCGDGGEWGELGRCEDEQGDCDPGAEENGSCGTCGTRSRTCGDDCLWEPWTECLGEHGCTPGAVDSQGCGRCGSQSRTCSDSCEWSSWSGCGGEGACSPGATQDCGNCGTQPCSASCQWGTCGGEGACSPGATQDCGNCGSQTCSGSCQWGSCGGEGVCEPGDICCPGAGDDRCSSCAGNARRDCRNDCTWGGCISSGIQC